MGQINRIKYSPKYAGKQLECLNGILSIKWMKMPVQKYIVAVHTVVVRSDKDSFEIEDEKLLILCPKLAEFRLGNLLFFL